MLKIDRLRIEIHTEDGIYGFDEEFRLGLNFLASENNTWGKSSVIEGIYYCLGFGEIIGGKGDKVLTAAYKSFIEDGDRQLSVLESRLYLQISNGEETVTLYRTAKMENRDSRLITVYFSDLPNIHRDVLKEDTYVHMPNSATNAKGFHKFLEGFLHIDIPKVLTTDGKQRKLYLQLVFSCMFIEQKHGWGDIFSGIPYLGIKDAKKRVLEFVLKLDTLDIEKNKEILKNTESRINSEWKNTIVEIMNIANRENCQIVGLIGKPQILLENDLLNIHILHNNQDLNSYIKQLQKECDNIDDKKPKVLDNFDELQEELTETEKTIEDFESDMLWISDSIKKEKEIIQKLSGNIEIVDSDLRNNKDAARIRDLGSSIGCQTSQGVCPLCQQHIDDSLIPKDINDIQIMSIDQNIKHLEAQKEMLVFAKEAHSKNKENLELKSQSIQGSIFTLRRLAKAIRNDLYAVDENISQAIIYKKIAYQNEIERLVQLKILVKEKIDKLKGLSNEWKAYLSEKKRLPSDKFSKLDIKKINLLKEVFVTNLKKYGYKSISNLKDIDISMENYLPIIEDFDMKFDSSASDNIRGIWAYTVALMNVSLATNGNHPRVLIFDEPKQHSIIPEDMNNFFNSIIKFENKAQTIIGITIEDNDTKNLIDKLNKEKYHLIEVKNKAFQKL